MTSTTTQIPSQATALSGSSPVNTSNITTNASNASNTTSNITSNITTNDKQVQDMIQKQELLDFLQVVDETEANELHTLTDRFVNIDSTNGPENSEQTSYDLATEKGVLSAEAILNTSALSPTGTQVISTLNIDSRVIESFASLRVFSMSAVHRRLASFVSQLQEAYGRKSLWSGSSEFAGYYAVIDPLLLATYIPYVMEVIDLRDDQIEECFHPFLEVDGYPTIQGVPFWERQEWERIEYYNLFKLYRDMRYAFYNESDALLTNRSLTVLSRATHVPVTVVSYLSTVYCWSLRISLYDSWMESMQQRRVAVKRSLMLDRHTKISQALIEKAFKSLKRQADKLTPKEAIEVLKLGITYERISAGISGDKPDGLANAGSNNSQSGPFLSIVNQTNNTSGPMQVNTSSQPAQQLSDDMKKPDTLVSVLSILQRSGALNVTAQKAAAESDPVTYSDNAPIDVTPEVPSDG